MTLEKSVSVDSKDSNDSKNSKDNSGDGASAAAVDTGAEVSTSVTKIPKENDEPTDWPLKKIKEPHKNDVLYGRGGGTNHHPGNKRYREMVERRKQDYVNSKRLDKPLVALEIIKEWRTQDPPGRFLKMDDNTGLWDDVGDKKAREKTSQALREKAPQCRKQDEIDYGHSDTASGKYTGFSVPHKNKVDLPLTLQRDHSLGRDILEQNEDVAVVDFSWGTGHVPESRRETDFHRVDSTWTGYPPDIVSEGPRNDPYDDMSSPARSQRQHLHLPAVNPPYTVSMPHTGWPAHKSAPVTPVRSAHVGAEYWPPQPVEPAPQGNAGVPATWGLPEYQKGMNHIQIPHDQAPSSEVEGCRHPDDYAQVADILHDHPPAHRTNTYPDQYHHGEAIPAEFDAWASPSRVRSSTSDGGRRTPRHSNMYVSRPMDTMEPIVACDVDPFAPTSSVRASGEGHFGGIPHPTELNTEIPATSALVSPASEASSAGTPRHKMHSVGGHSDRSPRHRPQSYTRSHGRSSPARQGKSNVRKSTHFEFKVSPYNHPDSPSDRTGNSTIPKPPPVKRDTSNQNENSETKRSVKKMNRQRSIGNRPSPHLDRVSEKEVASLGNSLEQSSLEHGAYSHGRTDQHNNYDNIGLVRPDKIKQEERCRTYDSFDFAIENSIGRTGNLEESLDLGSDSVPLSVGEEKDCVGWKQTSFPFPEHDSPEDSRRPMTLSNGDRLSSLGSIEGLSEGNELDHLVNNTGSVEAM